MTRKQELRGVLKYPCGPLQGFHTGFFEESIKDPVGGIPTRTIVVIPNLIEALLSTMQDVGS